jgi:hypothetical protein
MLSVAEVERVSNPIPTVRYFSQRDLLWQEEVYSP